MSDPGLEQAIQAAGSISELARRINVSQPSLSNWTRVPSGRVVAVEGATGVPRAVLRPDLYASTAALHETDASRAREYALLANLLLRAPDERLLTRVAKLRGDASALGTAHAALADAASSATADAVEREFFDLFIGVGRGELLPYASYYLTGFLHERPLARLREDLAALGIERVEGQAEPEDHAGILCEIMSGLIVGPFAAPLESQRRIFDRHLAPWLDRFFADLESARDGRFYRHVGSTGHVFVDIEREAFALQA